jgi:hypothetical protein
MLHASGGGWDGRYGYGDDDTNSDTGGHSYGSLTIVVRGEDGGVLEGSVD